MQPYAGVDYNLMSIPESTPKHVPWASGNPRPESTLTLCLRRLYPQPGTKNLASELDLRQIWVCPRGESQVRRQDRELARKGFWKLNKRRQRGCATSQGSIYLHPARLRGMIDESYLQPLQKQPVQLIIYSVQIHQTINHSAKLNKTKTLLYDVVGNRTWAGRQSHCTRLSACWNSTWHFFRFFLLLS